MVTPMPRAALITGKAFAAGVRSIVQTAVIVVLSAVLGVALTLNPLKLLGVVLIVVLGSAFFSCLSMSIAGVALSRDWLMGIGQAITVPLFSCPAWRAEPGTAAGLPAGGPERLHGVAGRGGPSPP